MVKIGEGLNFCVLLRDEIEKWLIDDFFVNLFKGGVMVDGFNEELDELCNIVNNSKDLLLGI